MRNLIVGLLLVRRGVERLWEALHVMFAQGVEVPMLSVVGLLEDRELSARQPVSEAIAPHDSRVDLT
ncbi:hypothetical protein OG215_38705 (plasmid) [Streptomyces globisporus]|uniref:hypothetical protein n=1 Tax=Streptomyces globisporus TaxID=1908 RepID=UPI0038701CFE|nr:hypothetical protein OG215_38705 [Streptomyces globisporus]